MAASKTDIIQINPLEKIVIELFPLALDYMALLRTANLLNPYSDQETFIDKKSLEEGLIKSAQHEFTRRLNEQAGFVNAKNKLIKYEQHIYLHLTRKLLASNESIFNAGKSHKQLFREFFIKKNIQLLYSIYNQQQQTPSFYADITMDIAGIFFTYEMDRSDCIKLADKIIRRVNSDLIFMHSSVGSWFYRISQEILPPENQS